MTPFVVFDGMFSDQVLERYERAREFVSLVPDDLGLIRCHELTRAVARYLGATVEVQDGHFGAVTHSWLWADRSGPMPPILDVYFPGVVPQVVLVHHGSAALPFRGCYRQGPFRRDIDTMMVSRIYRAVRDQLAAGIQPEPARFEAKRLSARTIR